MMTDLFDNCLFRKGQKPRRQDTPGGTSNLQTAVILVTVVHEKLRFNGLPLDSSENPCYTEH